MSVIAEIDNHDHPPETIDQFIEKFSVPPEDTELLLDYPGSRPDNSYITDGEYLLPLSNDLEEFHNQTNALLANAGVPPLEERIPVLAYGANASPKRLRDKMSGFGPDVQKLMQTVPHIKATLPGAMAVWHGRPGQVGSCFAELYPAEEEGASLEAHVAFLTPEQLAVLGISEGVTYSEAEVMATVQQGGASKEIPVLAYVALEASILLKDGKPIPVKGLKNLGTDLPEMTCREAVEYMLEASKGTLGEMTVEEFVAQGRKLKLSEKKARQARVQEELARQGLSGEFRYPVPEGALIGRADLSSLPGRAHDKLITLPEEILADIRPNKEQLEVLAKQELMDPKTKTATQEDAMRKVWDKVDPARRLTRRAMDEIEVRRQLSKPARVALAFQMRKQDARLSRSEALTRAQEIISQPWLDRIRQY